MDPYVVYDCQRVVPNQFALTLAAAARCRALNHGAEPRLVPSAGTGNAYLALHEIAAGVFGNTELASPEVRTRIAVITRSKVDGGA